MRRFLAAFAVGTGSAAAFAALFAGDSVAIAAPGGDDAGTADATSDGSPVTACSASMTGSMTAYVGCALTRDYGLLDIHDAAVPYADLHIRSTSTAANDPSLAVWIRLVGIPMSGPRLAYDHHVEARVEEGRLKAHGSGALTAWLARTPYQSISLELTSVRSVRVSGRIVHEVHGELDAQLPCENVAVGYAPPDVALHVSF